MLGAIIGDIVGSRFEFNPTNRMDFDLFHADCDFTDDTICTCAIADAIMNKKSYKDALLYWCRKYGSPMGGFGGSFRKWIDSEDPQPYWSFGNGSAMRVSPVAWLYELEVDVLAAAEDSAIVTHDHPEGIKGAQATALAIYMCKEGLSPQLAVRLVCDRFGYSIDFDYESVRNKFDETCQGTIPVALKVIHDSLSFEDAIRLAVSLGADADTLGAIVGSIAEAAWGIPDKIIVQALRYLSPEMKYIINQFYIKKYG